MLERDDWFQQLWLLLVETCVHSMHYMDFHLYHGIKQFLGMPHTSYCYILSYRPRMQHRATICHSWSQCWCCCWYLCHRPPGVLLCRGLAGCPHHLLLCEEREEQWTGTSHTFTQSPACPSLWWGRSRQAGVEREYCIWSSGQITGDEAESFIRSCETLKSNVLTGVF